MNLPWYKDNEMINSKRRMLREWTLKQIQINQERKKIIKSKSCRVWYYGLRETTEKHFVTIYFKALDFKGTGRKHLCRIVLNDYPNYLVKYSNLKQEDILRKALIDGNVRLHCTCESFQYEGYNYISTVKDYGLRKELRFPKIKNPELKGSLCKHLSSVCVKAPLFLKSIALDLQKKNYKQAVRVKTGNKIYLI